MLFPRPAIAAPADDRHDAAEYDDREE